MRVLHLTKWYPCEEDPQLGIFIRKHAIAASYFHSVALVHVSPGPDKLTVQKVSDNFTEIGGHYVRLTGWHGKLINPLRQLAAWLRALNYAGKHYGPFSGIHAHVFLRPALLARLYGSLKSIPYIVSEHWHGFATSKASENGWLWNKLLLNTANKACKITAVSAFLQQKMALHGIQKPVEVVPNVVEKLADDQSFQLKYEGRINIVTVGDLVDHVKNISGLLEAFKAAFDEYDICLHIAGDGKDMEKLMLKAEKLGLLDRTVFFYGRRSHHQVHELISQSSFLVINSYIETFSVVCAEALLHGKPVIATKCGGPEELVDESNGILLPPGDHSAMIKALQRMAAGFDTFDADKLASGITARYSSQAIGREWDKIYRNCFL